ncbi:polysaccharide biosynthesis protein [Bacteroidota bacterium]
MKNIFEEKDILVTGGCGSIGSEIVRQLLQYNPKRVRIFDNSEKEHFFLKDKIDSKVTRHLVGDIRDRDRLDRAMKGVDIVFHAAALKHVSLCEYNPFEAVQTNVVGTQNIIISAIQNNVEKVIGISTDKAVNPINTMGASKLLSEKLLVNSPIVESDTVFSCVRFGNVLASSGSVIPIFKEQIENGKDITITSDNMTRFFMTISEAVSLVLKTAEKMVGGEIFVLKMKSLRIRDLAEVMIEELSPRYGRNPKSVKIKYLGVRPGEKLYESLTTPEEMPFVEEQEDMFVINNPLLFPPKLDNGIKHANYCSDTVHLLSKKEIKDLLYKYKII